MARYKMFLDIWEGLDPNQHGLSATTMPMKKSESTKRLSFEISIPDEWIYKTDIQSAEIIEPKEE